MFWAGVYYGLTIVDQIFGIKVLGLGLLLIRTKNVDSENLGTETDNHPKCNPRVYIVIL